MYKIPGNLPDKSRNTRLNGTEEFLQVLLRSDVKSTHNNLLIHDGSDGLHCVPPVPSLYPQNDLKDASIFEGLLSFSPESLVTSKGTPAVAPPPPSQWSAFMDLQPLHNNDELPSISIPLVKNLFSDSPTECHLHAGTSTVGKLSTLPDPFIGSGGDPFGVDATVKSTVTSINIPIISSAISSAAATATAYEVPLLLASASSASQPIPTSPEDSRNSTAANSGHLSPGSASASTTIFPSWTPNLQTTISENLAVVERGGQLEKVCFYYSAESTSANPISLFRWSCRALCTCIATLM